MRSRPVKCSDVFRHICENLDQKLNAPECREIKKHIDRCPNCVAYLDSLKKTILLYREYPHPRLRNKARRRLQSTLKLRFSQIR